MLLSVVLLVFVAGSLGQQVAKEKCKEYTKLAKENINSPQCKTFTDKTSGIMVEPKEFPATGMLGYETPNKDKIVYLCDATIISHDTLVAAGHCFQQKIYGKPKWVRLGATHSTLGVEVEIKETLCHPQYKPGNDIALVKLKQKLNSSFVPACLDTEDEVDNTQGLGVGRPIGSAYIQLREKCPIKSWLKVVPAKECVDAFPRQNISTVATLCVKDPANGPGDCMSGPLYVSREPCVHTVAGLASFGKPCVKETPEGRTPSVYTRVAYYIKWIESLTWPEPK